MMEITDSLFPSDAMLKILISYDFAGLWSWVFEDDAHSWSNSLFRILGLLPGQIVPSYHQLLDFVHPADRGRLPSAAALASGAELPLVEFRVFTPHGTLRTLVNRGQVRSAPDGRPLGAAGVLIDLSDRAALTSIQADIARRRRAVFEQTRSFTAIVSGYGTSMYPPEFLELTGRTDAELLEDPVSPYVAEERNRWRDTTPGLFASGKPFIVTPTLILASGKRRRFESVVAPMSGPGGVVSGFAVVVRPHASTGTQLVGAAAAALTEAVDGSHLRAARALLDWTMQNLATASGLSFTTVRRLEDDAVGRESTSRHAAVAALRAAGIRFTLVEGTRIAVSRA